MKETSWRLGTKIGFSIEHQHPHLQNTERPHRKKNQHPEKRESIASMTVFRLGVINDERENLRRGDDDDGPPLAPRTSLDPLPSLRMRAERFGR